MMPDLFPGIPGAFEGRHPNLEHDSVVDQIGAPVGQQGVEHEPDAVVIAVPTPIVEVIFPRFPRVSLRYSTFDAEPHSLWLKCSAEYGLPMLVFFTLVVILLLVRLRRRARLARTLGDRDGEAMATALSCALFGFLATGTFTSQFLSEYMWAIIGLIGAFLATPLDTPLPPPPPEEPVPSTVARQKAA